MDAGRRRMLQQSCWLSLGFLGLQRYANAMGAITPTGTLCEDPDGLLELPPGFRYQRFSSVGETMDDGFRVPGNHDGMGAFAGPNGRVILVRNHELVRGAERTGAFGDHNELLERVPPEKLWDGGHGQPFHGGTTTLVYDPATKQLERHFLSLAGTAHNCAGGVTPWGTWITCEEYVSGVDDNADTEQPHGYNFEVPAQVERQLTTPVPIIGMGRFRHEAVAVDPATSIVYQTEDEGDGLIYRYIPKVPGELVRGGKLQALVLCDRPSADTRNWNGIEVPERTPMPTRWIDMEDITAPNGDLRLRGFDAGAARFARGEGMWRGPDGTIWFTCTNGGAKELGQIWRYLPSPIEGQSGEDDQPGSLELFIESKDDRVLRNCDNMTIAASGDLFVCEDSPAKDRLIRIRPDGTASVFARNLIDNAEFAGITFSPDGSVLFVNVQQVGTTIAIHGPWDTLQSS